MTPIAALSQRAMPAAGPPSAAFRAPSLGDAKLVEYFPPPQSARDLCTDRRPSAQRIGLRFEPCVFVLDCWIEGLSSPVILRPRRKQFRDMAR